MLRPARMGDIFGLVALLEEQYARSKYAGSRVGIDAPHARKLLAAMIQRHGGTHDGASFVMVEEIDGKPEAFIAGILDRVYQIGDMLAANDAFLVASPRATASAALKLLGGYIEWAGQNPRVHEIRLSHTDALPEGARIGVLYERLGFRRCGAIYEQVVEAAAERKAA